MSQYSEAITERSGNTIKDIHIDIDTIIGNGYSVMDLVEVREGNSIYKVTKEKQVYIPKVYAMAENLPLVAEVVKEIQSEYLLPLIDYGFYNEYYFEIYPFIECLSLNKVKKLNMDDLKTVIRCTNEALHILHTYGITHGDIKPSNIFWSESENKAIVCDYESATLQKEGYIVHSIAGTVEYGAPCNASLSWLTKHPEYDYGSLGITILDLYCGSVHFAGKASSDISKEWETGIIIPEHCPVRLRQLIKGLTLMDEESRFGYSEVVRWCDNEFVNTKNDTKFRQSNVDKTMVFGFDGSTLIKVSSLEELSLCINQYKNIAKQRFFCSMNSLEKLVDYVKLFDEAKAKDIRPIVKNNNIDTAVFMVANLLHPTVSLTFQGKYYKDLSELIEEMPADSVDWDFVNLIKGGSLQFFLNNNGENEVSTIVDTLVQESIGEDDFLYYLVKFRFSSGCGAVKLGLDIISTVEDLCEHIKNNGFDYIESGNNYAKICAWLYKIGYAQAINNMKEMIYNYE